MPPTDTSTPITNAPIAGTPAPIDHPPHRRWIIGVALVAAALIGTAAYAYWRSAASPDASVRTGPVKIGMVGFYQQQEAHAAFKARMNALGYEEGKDVVYDETFIFAGPNMIQELTENLDRLLDPATGADMLWLSLEIQAKLAVDMTRERGLDIPIVFISRFHDPVDYGLVASYRSSGNNATGVASNLFDIVQKHLEFYKEINPAMKTLGVFTGGFWVPELADTYFEEIKKQAPQFGLTVKEYTTTAPPPEAENAFNTITASIKKGDIDALMHLAGHPFETQQAAELALATRLGIPHAAPFEDLPTGGHFSYSDVFGASAAQSATMVDKIIKGTKPSDIPVEYGAHSELWLVMDRAEKAGIVFPDSMLFKAAQKFESEDDILQPAK